MRTVLAGRLRLVDLVGAGGEGSVWRAWDTRHRRCVAAKIVPGTSVPPTGPRHPHLLVPAQRLVDRDPTDGETMVSVMRLVRGGTADRLLAEHGALPSDFGAVLLDQLLQALDALHSAGLGHRDVKPANVLLEPTGTGRPHLLLGDLDTAVPLGGEPSTLAGTPGYVAPDTTVDSHADPRHDLYAAGVTTAELLTGRVPQRPDDLPRGPLRPLLARLIDPDPVRRPASAAEARRILGELGVPEAAPWCSRPHPPFVPDRSGPVPLRVRWAHGHGGYGARAAQ